ncbi:Uncharacterised protein [Mycobacteroides abscessus subsp. abscessus]|nr:Uncharacterised protein [Mycobacteroides abscessus subsp. abscessus]
MIHLSQPECANTGIGHPARMRNECVDEVCGVLHAEGSADGHAKFHVSANPPPSVRYSRSGRGSRKASTIARIGATQRVVSTACGPW